MTTVDQTLALIIIYIPEEYVCHKSTENVQQRRTRDSGCEITTFPTLIHVRYICIRKGKKNRHFIFYLPTTQFGVLFI